MGSQLRLLPQILQLTTILCICLFFKWISRMYSIIGHMGPVSCYIIMMDVVFLNHPVLCCDMCMRFRGSVLRHMRLMSIQTPFLLLLFTDSLPAALSPT